MAIGDEEKRDTISVHFHGGWGYLFLSNHARGEALSEDSSPPWAAFASLVKPYSERGSGLEVTVSPPALNPQSGRCDQGCSIQTNYSSLVHHCSLKTAGLSSPIECYCPYLSTHLHRHFPLSVLAYQSPVSFSSKRWVKIFKNDPLCIPQSAHYWRS